MSTQIEGYISLMSFISKAIGPDFELSLIDVKKNRIIAMEYGNISGIRVGEGVSPIAQEAIEKREFENSDYIFNRASYSKSGKILRSSLFFIKDDDGKLEGIMSIDFDDSRYEELGKKIMFLCHPDNYMEYRINNTATFYSNEETILDNTNQGEKLTIEESIESIVDKELNEVLVPIERLTQEEKVKIVKNLDKQGIFMMKGAVNILSKRLDISQASVYRYINLARED